MTQLTLNLQGDLEPAGEITTSSLLAGFRNHANPTHSQESEKEKMMIAISGRKCLEQFEKFNRHGSWARTFAASLIGMEGWYSTRCRLTWKLRGTKSSRLYFQLAASTLPTDGTESGLLLTPTTREEVQDLDKFQERMKKYPNGTKIPNLATQVMGLLPTVPPESRGKRSEEGMSKRHSMELQNMAIRGLLPTPKTQDSRHALSDRGKSNLGEEMSQWGQDNGIGFQLNPQFCLEMMGFKPNHCDSEFEKIAWDIYQKKKLTKSFLKLLMNGAKNQSNRQGTL